MKCGMVSFVVVGLSAALALAQQAEPVATEDPAHNELRALKENILQAFSKGDLDALLTCVHPNAVVTWQNGEVSRGHEGIRGYYKKMMEGPDRRVDKVTAKAEVDELTILYGDDNGLAFGTLDEDFTLTDGSQFPLKNRWTAHVVKRDDEWVVSGLHVSADIFDNGFLHLALRQTAMWVGLAAAAVGVLLGLLLYGIVGAFRRRRMVSRSTP